MERLVKKTHMIERSELRVFTECLWSKQKQCVYEQRVPSQVNKYSICNLI